MRGAHCWSWRWQRFHPAGFQPSSGRCSPRIRRTLRKFPLLSSCARGCRLATITGRSPAGVSLCPDVHCPAETRHLGHCGSSFLLNLHSLIWLLQGHRHNSRPNSFRNRRPRLGNARPFHPTPLPSLFLEPGLVHVCIPKATNKLCLERKVLRVLLSSKLKTSPARERQF